MTKQIDWWAKQPSQMAFEMLRSLRHCLQAQSHGHHTIDRLEETGMERGSARRSSLKGRESAIVSQMNRWNRFKGDIRETSERWGGAHMVFSECIDTPSSTELSLLI